MRAGKPLQEEPKGESRPRPEQPLLGAQQDGSGSVLSPPVQAELTITFEAIGIMLDTRELELWLDLST